MQGLQRRPVEPSAGLEGLQASATNRRRGAAGLRAAGCGPARAASITGFAVNSLSQSHRAGVPRALREACKGALLRLRAGSVTRPKGEGRRRGQLCCRGGAAHAAAQCRGDEVAREGCTARRTQRPQR